MYLTKLLIRDFGKFHNKSMDLTQGINILYGDKEAGKSTVRDFLVGLMYGIPRREGITRVRSNYDLRKPKNSNNYSGTAYMYDGDKSYLIDRSFLAGAKKASVLDIMSGREVKLKNSDTISGTLCETDKNTYLDTKCIVEDDEGDTKKDLQDYLTNITLTGTANIDKAKAIKYLENEKKTHIPKPLVRRLDELDERLSEYETVDDDIAAVEAEIKVLNEEFIMEAERRKRVARRMVENEDGTVTYEADTSMEEKIDRITEKDSDYAASKKAADEAEEKRKEEKREANKNKKFTDRFPVILATGIFVILVIAAVVHILNFDEVVQKLFVIFTCLAVFFVILDGYNAKGLFSGKKEDIPDEAEFNKVLEELKEEAEQQEEVEFDMTFAKEYQDKKAELKEKEDALLTRRNERNKLRLEFDTVFKKKSELEDEMAAIDYAISKINALSEQYKEDAFKNLLGNVSRYIRKITLGEFSELTFDSNGGIILKAEYGYVPISQLTDSDAGKVYLAVRLSIAKYLSKESMPLIIDGTSMLESASEIKALADCLMDMKEEQIIILTDDWGLDSVFKGKGIETNMIKL
ncbi:MAG: AAA family ATPase [Eubacterium sp.]|nr:AAA family ATPase [Eubacterium sp.]